MRLHILTESWSNTEAIWSYLDALILDKYLLKGLENLQIENFALKTNKQKSKTKLYKKFLFRLFK